VTRGTISFSISIHLPLSDASMLMNPVMLPPGRGGLSTNPLPTGSETMTHDGDGFGFALKRGHDPRRVSDQHIGSQRDQFFGKEAHAIDIGGGETAVDLDVASLDPAQPFKRRPECR
jgi:hypothetical protein